MCKLKLQKIWIKLNKSNFLPARSSKNTLSESLRIRFLNGPNLLRASDKLIYLFSVPQLSGSIRETFGFFDLNGDKRIDQRELRYAFSGMVRAIYPQSLKIFLYRSFWAKYDILGPHERPYVIGRAPYSPTKRWRPSSRSSTSTGTAPSTR